MIKHKLCGSNFSFCHGLTHKKFPDLSIFKLQGHSAISEAVAQADHMTIHRNV